MTIMNVALSREISGYLEICGRQGAYVIVVNSENSLGSAAIFAIGSANGSEKRIKRLLSIPGNNGEELTIVWMDNDYPILCYDQDDIAPEYEMHYNVKIV